MKLQSTAHAIPTKWRGIQFRSRLEARWAAFFTAMGWEWSYEPIDLQGYIPDFILHMHQDVLVEVKPFTRFEDPVIPEAEAKILSSGWSGPSGVVGARFTGFWVGRHLVCDGLCSRCFHYPYWHQNPGQLVWRLALDANRKNCLVCGRNEYASEPDKNGSQFCDHGYERVDLIDRRVAMWNEAGNAVQWRGRS